MTTDTIEMLKEMSPRFNKKVLRNTIIKELAQELRKRNPYQNENEDDFEWHWGYDRACDELEKMEKEK